MRKILSLSTVLFISFSLFAQKPEKTFNVQGAINTSTLVRTNKGVSGSYGYVYGYSVGFNLHTVYPSQWGWEGGLNFIQKGGKFNNTLGNPRAHLGYLEGNFAVVRNFPLQNGDDVFANAGIFIGGGIAGKIKSDSSKINVPWDKEWKRIDFGLQLKTGYTFHKTITLGLFMDGSLTNSYLQYVVPGSRPGLNGKNFTLNIFGAISLNSLFHIVN